MWVLHAHWQPSRRQGELDGVLFWAETSDAAQPDRFRGQMPKRFHPNPHPFSLPPQVILEKIGAGTPFEDAEVRTAVFRLPTSRTGPLPSPELNHSWDLDSLTPPFLSPWQVSGLWLPARKAFSILTNLPRETRGLDFSLGVETRYWQTVCNLVLEVLAEQKILPVLKMHQHAANRIAFQARWMAVLDGPRDGPRLAHLLAAMPPVCRSETRPDRIDNPPTPRSLLDGFINGMCDALARSWGRTRDARALASGEHPLERWLAALFTEDAVVSNASVPQLQALSSSLTAWMRNLRASGDTVFRVAFRLETPEAQPDDTDSAAWKIEYLLQAREDPSLLIPASEVWRRQSVFTQLGKRFEQPQEKLLAGLGYAGRLFPPLLESLQVREPTGVELDTQTTYAFLRQAAPLLEQAGFGLLVPPWWNQRGSRLGVRLVLKPQQAAPSSSKLLTLNALVSYEWQLSLGDTALTREEFEAIAALKMPLVQIRGQWVQLDTEQVEAAMRFWERQQQSGEMSLLQAAQLALDEQSSSEGLPLDEVVTEGWVTEWLDRLSSQDRLSLLPQPSHLQGDLRPYQVQGFSWLAFFRRWGLGAILADDMGLGKTIQALALLLHEKESLGSLPAPVLLVCPTSVVTNWQREARRFAPGLNVMIHQGPDRLKNSSFGEAVRKADLVVTSYALLRMDAETIQAVNWYGVILDEAQNIKNPAAKQTQAARKLNAGFRLALTGTPVENRLTELWSIMHFLNPGYLGTQTNFRREFVLPIERFGDPDSTDRLRKMVSPFILRRLKSDPNVIQDLPDKIEMKEYCNLSEEQATLYEAVVQDTMRKIAESDGIERRGKVLTLLLQLKQICNHPAQYLHEGETAIQTEVINGRSGKLNRLLEMLEEVLESGDRALIFTQFTQMGDILSAALPHVMGVPVLYLHGGTPALMRDQMVRRFQEDERGPQLFILSLKAGGLGLNLTRASHVFHFDRWWNPAVEDQATDRTYRIGQHQNVTVHKFITVGTLEEKIDELIESKKGLAEAVIGSGEQWLTELSTDELREMVALRR